MIYVLIPTIVILIVLLVAGYVKAPPNKAAIITGISKKPRVLLGKSGFKIPFFERVDWLDVGQINVNVVTEDYIPTRDFINIRVDAIAQVAMEVTNSMVSEAAMRNFLNKKPDVVRAMITESLQGNLREIIGTMDLKSICQDKAAFSTEVRSNAEQDMKELGIRILSFNVQNISDKDNLIDNLGMDNREQIRKSASIAKAEAEKEVAIARAQADNESNAARVRADEEIAKRDNDLAIKKAKLKEEEDRAVAIAEAAKGIQAETERKSLETQKQLAEIAKREKEIELQEREAEVAEKKLDAEVRKKAEAEKFAREQTADAELYEREKQAEAVLIEKQKEAEGIRSMAEAEAEAIQKKGIAEAEALDRKAEAMKKYGQAAILEMIVGILPDVAKSVAEPLTAIDKVTIIGGDSNGVADIAGNVPMILGKVIESVKEATGIDIHDIVKAQTFEGKTTKNINFTGLNDSCAGNEEEVLGSAALLQEHENMKENRE